MYKILIADDDKAMLSMVEQVLDEEGYVTRKATTSQQVLDIVNDEDFDLFLIDLALTGKDRDGGLSLCRRLRDNPITAEVPIIFLTNQQDVSSVVKALEAGGDDYIRKPFAMRELTARLRAHLRRVGISNEDVAMVRINPETYQVFVDSREVHLTKIEFDLLYYMAHTPKKWHKTSDLLANVWNYPNGVGDTALVRNHIRNLRRKLEINPDHPSIVQSRHGRGYALQALIQVEYST
ncbi:MAG: response regulator transcription factor [Chloroflexota bacterium]